MTKIEKLRSQLKDLRKKRDKAIFEKGLAAQENKDLRENFAYDYWERQENLFTAQIREITAEIETLYKNQKKK